MGQLINLDFEWPEELALCGGQERRVWVWLPPTYNASSGDYRVLFMHDGQNVFRDEDATFGTCWGMIHAQLQLEEPMIVVAIEGQNNGTRRFSEFSPWVNHDLVRWKGGDDLRAGGNADPYLEFIATVIVPAVHSQFRCKTAPEHNFLGGSSMGGFVSLYAATRYESVFGNYMAMSTATWFAHDELMSCLAAHNFKESTRVYADIGTNETSNDQLPEFPSIYVQGNQALFHQLTLSLADGQFLSQVCADAIHNEAAWALRLPRALHWLTARK